MLQNNTEWGFFLMGCNLSKIEIDRLTDWSITYTLQMRELKVRKVTGLVLGHTSGEGWGEGWVRTVDHGEYRWGRLALYAKLSPIISRNEYYPVVTWDLLGGQDNNSHLLWKLRWMEQKAWLLQSSSREINIRKLVLTKTITNVTQPPVRSQ